MEETINDSFACMICLDVCVDAVETSCCHQLLCEVCTSSLKSCPACRNSKMSVIPSIVVRRIIGGLPAVCECGYNSTIENIKAHKDKCTLRPLQCVLAGCEFKGPQSELLGHVVEVHPAEVIQLCTSGNLRATFKRDCIAKVGNARIGLTGKYYCGGKLDTPCSCCNGYCGTSSGCNCLNCMRLDIEARALPLGYLVNREGRMARKGSTGNWYCGAKQSHLLRSDGWCGPTDGPQCNPCKILESQIVRYASLL